MDKCEDFRQYLAACADGELEGELGEQVRRHVETCERCRSECAALMRVVELYRESAPPEVPGEEWERVEAALEKCLAASAPERATATKPAVRRRFFGWWLLPAAGLAAAVLLVALVVGLPGARTSMPTAQVYQLETGPDYEAMVRLPMDDDDVLVIDVVQVE
jgi:anti-sigma factor RsiW